MKAPAFWQIARRQLAFRLFVVSAAFVSLAGIASAGEAPEVEVSTWEHGGEWGVGFPLAVGQGVNALQSPNQKYINHGTFTAAKTSSGVLEVHVHEVIQSHSSGKIFVLDRTIPVLSGPLDENKPGWISWGDGFKTAAYTTGKTLSF